MLNRLRSIINQIITKSTNIFNTRVSLIARTTRIKNVRSTNVDENFNFFDERKFKNKKQRDNFLTNNVSRELSDSTISLRFDNRKRNYVFLFNCSQAIRRTQQIRENVEITKKKIICFEIVRNLKFFK